MPEKPSLTNEAFLTAEALSLTLQSFSDGAAKEVAKWMAKVGKIGGMDYRGTE